MRQLVLDLLPNTPPSLDNFVAGSNDETLSALSAWLAGQTAQTAFHLWGEPASGKSHLLAASGFDYIDAGDDADLSGAHESSHLAVDNVEALSDNGQIALFNHFNRLRFDGGRLLTGARQSPRHLTLREDLRTRLGSGLIYRLHSLTDGEKLAALSALAQSRAMQVPPEWLDYLLRHAPRDMRSLSALIVALDRYSLEHKRPLTLPLLRTVLQDALP